MKFILLAVLPLVLAGICPQESHQVCNEESDRHACTCAVTPKDESYVKEQSCNNLIDDDEETGNFPVVSVTFTLDEAVDGLDEFPEDTFREKIADSLRVDEDDILVLRQSCSEDNDQLVVQFAILKKDNNETELPYEEDDFIDAESIANRMKAMGQLSQIANIDVEEIEFTEELEDIEGHIDNSQLLIQGIIAGLVFGVMFILGLVFACRHRGYSDDLQKP